MTPLITISLDVPDGTTIFINGVEAMASARPSRDPVEEYWSDYLSSNGHKLYWAAAKVEEARGPGYTFEDIAAELKGNYESAKSYHRNSGRTAGRWQREKGSPAPIQLEFDGNYGPQEGAKGWRSRYALPADVAAKIVALSLQP